MNYFALVNSRQKQHSKEINQFVKNLKQAVICCWENWTAKISTWKINLIKNSVCEWKKNGS